MKVRNIQPYFHKQMDVGDLAKEKWVGGCLEVVTF